MRISTILTRFLPLGFLCTSAFLGSSCAPTPVVEVVLQDPHELREKAAFAQLAIFEGGCPVNTKLADGDISGNRWAQSVEAGGSFGEIGNLGKADYGFVAILRDEQCGVMGFGCTPVNLAHHRYVTVAVNELVNPPRGTCKDDQVCENSVCIAGNGKEAGPDVDAGPLFCELELIASGSFDLPKETGTRYNGPAVVATPSGFVVMYREAAPSGDPQAIRIGVSDSGDTISTSLALPACEDTTESDGIGAAWNNAFNGGLMVVAVPPCDELTPRLHVSGFDGDGKSLGDHTYVEPPPPRLLLNPIKSVAPSPGSKNFLLAAMAGGVALLYVFEDGIHVQTNPPPLEIHKGQGTATFTQIATSSGTRVLLTDSDLDEGSLVVSLADTGSGSTVSTTFERSSVSSLVAWSERAAMIQPQGNLLAWHVLNKGGSTIKDGTLTGGPYTAMDVAQLHDYLLIAAGQAGAVSVFRLDDANGTFSGSSTYQVKLSSAGNPSLKDFKGERIAMASARGRVIVTWITNVTPMTGTSVAPGGYAVLGCDG